ncbi:MAG TPA: tetratricopeptide repeat protein [Anaerolineae bacterium]|nr:tetratricopeptide repeat protein [Anaerolineae bacterium]
MSRLEEGLSRRMILLSAPAGSGKTTLLSQWIADLAIPVAWLSLDERDNDLARFLTYLVAALRGVSDEIGSELLTRLRATKPSPDEELLTSLVNDLARLEEHVVLVLDDYHVFEEKRIHQAMSFLVDHLPATTHLVIASRSDPPLPISLMRGRGELLELRMADIHFTAQESLSFFRHLTGIDLNESDIASLHARTEGWIAGLQMAALSVCHQADPAAFIRSFAGDDHYIMDYLIEEVLSQQTEEVRRFLLRSSLLERFTAALCDAVVYDDADAGKSRKLLEEIEKSNLFLVALDQRREWFRFHPLFADLLRQRLLTEDVRIVTELHKRAGAWYWHRSANGKDQTFVSAAIEHALDAGDLKAAVEWIETAAEPTFMRSEITTFLHWVERVPDEMLAQQPLLCLLIALALTMKGEHPRLIDKWIEKSEIADDGTYTGERAAIEALLLNIQGESDRSVELSHRALEALPEDRLFMRSLVADSLGLCYLMQGKIDAAIDTLEEAARLGEKIGSVITAAGALSSVAGLVMNAGQLKRAQRLYHRCLALAVDERGQQLPIAGKALLGLGELAREWNDLDAAEAFFRQAIECMKLYNELGNVIGYLGLSRLAQDRGDLDGAAKNLERSIRIAKQTESIEMDDRITMLQQIRLWLKQGNFQPVEDWMQETGLRARPLAGTEAYQKMVDREFFYVDLVERLTQIRVHLAIGEAEAALEIARAYLVQAERLGQMKRVIEFLILQALALSDLERSEEALEVLDRSLALAEPEGYLRLFIDEGRPMAVLLYKALQAGSTPQYTARILAAFEDQVRAETIASELQKGESLIEALSDREIEVLSLVAEGLTNQQIAQKLVLSLSTVKWHTSNIYGKLGVSNRSQAVARARSLGIL